LAARTMAALAVVPPIQRRSGPEAARLRQPSSGGDTGRGADQRCTRAADGHGGRDDAAVRLHHVETGARRGGRPVDARLLAPYTSGRALGWGSRVSSSRPARPADLVQVAAYDGKQAALTTVVLVRRYSPNWGSTSDESEIATPGSRFRSISAACRSCSGKAYE